MTPEQAYMAVWREVYRTVPLIPALAKILPALPEAPALNGATPTLESPGIDLAGCRTQCLPEYLPQVGWRADDLRVDLKILKPE